MGLNNLLISLSKGKIKDVDCYSDAMEVEFIDEIKKSLLGLNTTAMLCMKPYAQIKNDKSQELAKYLQNELRHD